jgi:type II secretory pathway predicted ATPase ExeA
VPEQFFHFLISPFSKGRHRGIYFFLSSQFELVQKIGKDIKNEKLAYKND